MTRTENELLPSFTAELYAIRENGIGPELLQKIIQKHAPNATYNRGLYKRYMAIREGVPIFSRQPRFEEEAKPLNNKINNDFFSEIVDFKTGYFAGNPIGYGYNKGKEGQEVTGGSEGVDIATRTVTDFTTRNNMFGVDMETTRYASIYGYAGRLFYIEKEGNERVMPVHGFETIVLSDTDITEPEYAIRYYKTENIDGAEECIVEFYDDHQITTYKGTLHSLKQISQISHGFDYCPLQAVANNKECMGDAEKVLALIDDYDKILSDNSNEIEAFVHAYLIFDGLRVDDDTIKRGQRVGSFVFPPGGTQKGSAYFLTKQINDAFTEHHLQRLEDNIYRFSKTPNLNDTQFNNASGVSLKFKLHSLETKCGAFEAKMMDAGKYMWKLLASAWRKRGINVNPLQVIMSFKRTFPVDMLSEAQTAQALIAASFPRELVYSLMSFVDDPDYVMELAEAEKDAVSLYEDVEKVLKTDE